MGISFNSGYILLLCIVCCFGSASMNDETTTVNVIDLKNATDSLKSSHATEHSSEKFSPVVTETEPVTTKLPNHQHSSTTSEFLENSVSEVTTTPTGHTHSEGDKFDVKKELDNKVKIHRKKERLSSDAPSHKEDAKVEIKAVQDSEKTTKTNHEDTTMITTSHHKMYEMSTESTAVTTETANVEMTMDHQHHETTFVTSEVEYEPTKKSNVFNESTSNTMSESSNLSNATPVAEEPGDLSTSTEAKDLEYTGEVTMSTFTATDNESHDIIMTEKTAGTKSPANPSESVHAEHAVIEDGSAPKVNPAVSASESGETTTAGVTETSGFNHVAHSTDLATEMVHSGGTEPTLVDVKSRREKQMNLQKSSPCSCDGMEVADNSIECLGQRTMSDPKCPCRTICAMQAFQSCNESLPCDKDFGLNCMPETSTCQGQLGIKIFDVTHNSAKVEWGLEKSELHPQATLSYTTAYRGSHTIWIDVEASHPMTVLEHLLPNKDYFVKVEEDGKQEIGVFKTLEDTMGTAPKLLITQVSPTTLTVVWDDFRLPSHHSEYVLEYQSANATSENWMKVQAGSQPIVTVTQLKPNTAYRVRVAVWEDGSRKLERPSEVVTVHTKDGCVKNNRTYSVGDEFFHGCDLRCICEGGDHEVCSPRCNTPYIKVGSRSVDQACYEKPVPSDPCCVIIMCTEGKSLNPDKGEQHHKPGECPEIVEESISLSKSCLSDCDRDEDCNASMKCCPSSCGGAVCVQPIIVGNICENIYCGPNAKCVAEKMSCECMDGYEGHPHDFLNGCKLSSAMKNTSSTAQNASDALSTMSSTVMSASTAGSVSEASVKTHDGESEVTTSVPFELDLSKSGSPMFKENTTWSKDGMHIPKLEDIFNDTESRNHGHDIHTEVEDDELNATYDENAHEKDAKKKHAPGGPAVFDGCEFNNITYDRGVRFEDGCEARCTCDGPGHVTCVPRCSILSSGGKSCREVPDPDDSCCKIMVCSFPGNEEMENIGELSLKILSAQPQNGTTVRIRMALSSSQLPTMVGQESLEVWYAMATVGDENNLAQWNKRPVMLKELTEVQHGVFEFDVNELMPDKDYFFKVAKERQGSSKLYMAEFSNTVNAKTFSAAVKTVFQGCFHHNQSYNLGEMFFQGCEFKCICRENGFIECQDRCEIYIDTVGYEGCDWIPSEEDPCCMIPSCQRRKIPLLPGSRLPPFGPMENMCVVNNNEFYRVGDIWELDDGCKTKICRCAMLPNGTTTIQCQSECPALPPNAHIPTARCPNPILMKPDGPCTCPYISCNEAPPRHVMQPPRPQCDFKGKRYDIGQEFHDGCIALCHCSQDLRVSCAAIECPYHFSAEFTNCLEWDIDPDFFPTPPQCCAPSKCKKDGSCFFSGEKFDNFADIPAELLPCGARCVCVNGNVTCENRCPPVEDVPPPNMPCPPSLAYKGHPAGETCCLRWMCKEPPKQAYCLFQGSRYLLSEQWEVRKGSTRRLCSCHMGSNGSPQVECKGGCPQIPQRFILPSEQCARPFIITPDDPVMCPYVVCNNSVTAQELYNVNVVSLNSTAVRIRFTLANILVGLVGHAELHFTTDPTLPPSEWHIQKFSRPKRLFDSPNIEYILNALRPNTTYFVQVKIKIDALQGGPESELFKLKMPEEVIPTSTTTLPPIIMLDAKPEVHVIDANTARISWRNFEPQEKKFIYAVQLKYKKVSEAGDKWITTPMIHRDVTSYFLHDLEPSTPYTVDMLFMAPKELPTKLVSVKSLEFKTMGKSKGDYNLHVAVNDEKMAADSTEFVLSGIPEPISKYVHLVKILYKTPDGKELQSFKEPKTNKLELDDLEPGKRYLVQMELYLTNGHTLNSNEVEFITKHIKTTDGSSAEHNVISRTQTNGKLAEPYHSQETKDNDNHAYFIALVVVAVVAAVAGFGFILLLVLLVRRQASAKAPISRTPSESAYDNPTYKTYDGERLEDKTNGQAIQTTQA